MENRWINKKNRSANSDDAHERDPERERSGVRSREKDSLEMVENFHYSTIQTIELPRDTMYEILYIVSSVQKPKIVPTR